MKNYNKKHKYNGKYKGLFSEGIRTTGSLIMSSGRVNDYRLAFYNGQGASAKEKTWNRKKRMHVCCKSKVPWRHKVGCGMLKKDFEVKENKDELLNRYFG